MIIICSIRI